jgi:hypothetical protein
MALARAIASSSPPNARIAEALISLIGGVAFGAWSVVFRAQAGPLAAEVYLWALSAPLGIAFEIGQALLFVACYFVARRVSQWRWRHVLGKQQIRLFFFIVFVCLCVL